MTNGVLEARLEVAIRDIDDLLDLDANRDGFVVWEEIQAREKEFAAEVDRSVSFSTGAGPLVFQGKTAVPVRRAEGGYVRMERSAPLGDADGVRLDYRLFAVRDPLHRVLVKFQSDGEVQTAVLGSLEPRAEFQLKHGNRSSSAWGFFREGVHHIWTGYDHLAFLLALLLPSVLERSPSGWRPADRIGAVLVRTFRIVTAFTVAHSMTLGLASLGWVRLPSRWVETAIAASILVAVSGNLVGREMPVAEGAGGKIRRWLRGHPATLALVFGWIHGFGFAGALEELGLGRSGILVPLFSFNLGVEAGQLACVGAFLPVAWLASGHGWYRRRALPTLSVLIALLAACWMVDRMFGLGWMPF